MAEQAPGDGTEPEASSQALLRAANGQLAQLLARPLAAGLYLVATPIGHLGDVTLRALAVMATAGQVYCEDTRHSRKLLDRYGLRRRLRTYQEHNAEQERPAILAQLAAGGSVALLSDAGTPLVSDPGYKLVRDTLAAGGKVFSIPGPSAVLAAVTQSGLPSDCFTFAGFLPVKPGPRSRRLWELLTTPGTLVLFEAPGRVAATLTALGEVFGTDRPAAVARELTKLHEEMRTGSLAELRIWAETEEVRGEAVILVAPVRQGETEASDQAIVLELNGETGGTLRDRVDAVATRLRSPRKRVYDLALRLLKERSQ